MLVALAAFADKAASQEAPTQPVIVLAHGRDQDVNRRDEIERSWRAAVMDALKSKQRTVDAGDVSMFWYADILSGSDQCHYATGAGEVADRAPGWSLWSSVRDGLLAVAAQLPNALQRRLLSSRLEDVTAYLSNGGIACGVDTRFQRMLNPATGAEPGQPHRPIIIVAHSLGSMVVYKNLMNRPPDSSVYFLTIGSMLGNASVQRSLLGTFAKTPAPVPLPVRRWRNFVNRGDLLAFDASKAFASEIPEKRPVDVKLKLDNEDKHSAADYLASAAFAVNFRESWCLASGLGPDCLE